MNRLLLANRNAYGVRNLLAHVLAGVAASGVGLSLALRNHSASLVANVLGALLANPVANLVAACLCAALGNHLASGVVASLGAALRNHLASGVIASLLTAFLNHVASLVANGLAAWLANHSANLVGASLLSALRNHLAGSMSYGLLSALRNHSANRVRYALTNALSLVSNTVDFLRFACWYPNLLADGLWWALNALDSASTWAVYALALRSVPSPSTRLADGSSANRTRNLFGSLFPMSTINLNGLGVVYWVGDIPYDFTSSCFLLRNHDRVVNNVIMCFINRLHYRVVNHSFTSFVHWAANCVINNSLMCFVNGLVNRVIDHFAVSLVYGLHNRIVDHFAVSLIHRLHDGVVDFACASLVHWSAHIVGHLSSVRLVHRLHDCVLTSFRLVHRLANYLVDSAVTCFLLHASYVNDFVFCHRLVFGSSALLGFLLINRAAHILHDSVRGWSFTAIHHTSATILVANRTAVSGVSLARY